MTRPVRAAVMQPYMFPYLGYFQLIRAVDHFIVFDDVNFRKKSYINRNSILGAEEPQRFTLSLAKVSQNKLINQTFIVPEPGNRSLVADLVRRTYAEAPQFGAVWPLVESCLLDPEENVALYNARALERVARYYGLGTTFHLSSQRPKDDQASAQDRIIEMALGVGAMVYVNAPGGRDLYQAEDFAARGLELRFLEPRPVRYDQGRPDFTANLSFIDVMMFNSPEQVLDLLDSYNLG